MSDANYSILYDEDDIHEIEVWYSKISDINVLNSLILEAQDDPQVTKEKLNVIAERRKELLFGAL